MDGFLCEFLLYLNAKQQNGEKCFSAAEFCKCKFSRILCVSDLPYI